MPFQFVSHFYHRSVKPQVKRLAACRTRVLWGWLLGFLLLGLLLASVKSTVGWKETLAAWSQLSLATLLAAIALFVCSHVIRAYRIFEYSRSAFSNYYGTALKVSSLHQLANNLLPMRMGEAAYPMLMQRYTHTNWVEGSVRLLFLRLLDLWVAGTVFSFVLLSLALGNMVLSFVLCLTLTLMLFALWIGWLMPALSRGHIPSWLASLARRWAVIATLVENLRLACDLSRLEHLRLIAWTWLAWGAKLLAYSVLLAAMTDLTPVAALSAAFTGEMSSLLPIHGVAGAGTFEAAFVLGAQVQPAILNQVIAAAVNIHLFVLSVSVLMALISLPIKVKNIGSLPSASCSHC